MCLDSKSTFLTITMPGPSLSLACQFSRERSDTIVSKLRLIVKEESEEEIDLMALVEKAKRLIEEEEGLMLEKETQRSDIKDENVEVLVAKLDHMRDATQYMKTLAKWCAELHLTMMVVLAKDMGVVVVVEGEESDLGGLINRF